MNHIHRAYTFIALLISCSISVIIVGAITKSVSWALETMHHLRFRGKRLIAAQSAFDILIKDCISASEQKDMWIKTSIGWVYKSGKQWILWHQRNNEIYRKYGSFDPKSETWISAQNESIAPAVATVLVEPFFVENHLHAVELLLSITDAYEKKVTFSTIMQ